MNKCIGCNKEINDNDSDYAVCTACWDSIGYLPINAIKLINHLLSQVHDLQKDSDMLQALTICGVDNWSGYSDAIRYLENGEEDY